MRAHLPFPRHSKTEYITLDTGACIACGSCAENCPNKVMGMISFGNHRHAHVDNAKNCTGCLTCVGVCDTGSLQAKHEMETATL